MDALKAVNLFNATKPIMLIGNGYLYKALPITYRTTCLTKMFGKELLSLSETYHEI